MTPEATNKYSLLRTLLGCVCPQSFSIDVEKDGGFFWGVCVSMLYTHVLEEGCGYRRACCVLRSGALLVLLFHIHCCSPRALLQCLFIDNKRHTLPNSLNCSEHKHNGQPGKNTHSLISKENTAQLRRCVIAQPNWK